MNKKLVNLFCLVNGFLLAILLIINVIGFSNRKTHYQNYQQKKQLVSQLLLVDFCISTESPNTRNFTMFHGAANAVATFQDFPAYHEHFASSSFIQTP
jgi:hypothetical protein